MAIEKGISEVDFGFSGNEAQVVVTSQTSILVGDHIEAYVMAGDTTTDHTAEDHRWFAAFVGITCGTIVASTSFTIYVKSIYDLTGKYKIRWVRAS